MASIDIVFQIISRSTDLNPASIIVDLASFSTQQLNQMLQSPDEFKQALADLGYQTKDTIHQDSFFVQSSTISEVVSAPLSTPKRSLLRTSDTATPHVAQGELAEEDASIWQNMDTLEVPWDMPSSGMASNFTTSSPPPSPPPTPTISTFASTPSSIHITPPRTTTTTTATATATATATKTLPTLSRLSTALQVAVRSELTKERDRTNGNTSKSKLAAMVQRKMNDIITNATSTNKDEHQSYIGRMAVDTLSTIVSKRKKQLNKQSIELETTLHSVRTQLALLEKHEQETEIFLSQENQDVQLDIDYKIKKRQKSKEDVLIPMNKRGVNSSSKSKTFGVGFGRNVETDTAGSGLVGNDAACRSPNGVGESDIAIETQRQRNRSTRTQLIIARIVNILHSEEKELLVSRYSNNRTSNRISTRTDGTTYNTETYIDSCTNNNTNTSVPDLLEQIKTMQLEKETYTTDREFEINELTALLHSKNVAMKILTTGILQLKNEIQATQSNQILLKNEITSQLFNYSQWEKKEMSFTRYEYEKLISSLIMASSNQVLHAKEQASEQEQITRRAFAAAFEARIHELEHELLNRDDELNHLNVQLDQYKMKMKSAEDLLTRLR